MIVKENTHLDEIIKLFNNNQNKNINLNEHTNANPPLIDIDLFAQAYNIKSKNFDKMRNFLWAKYLMSSATNLKYLYEEYDDVNICKLIEILYTSNYEITNNMYILRMMNVLINSDKIGALYEHIFSNSDKNINNEDLFDEKTKNIYKNYMIIQKIIGEKNMMKKI